MTDVGLGQAIVATARRRGKIARDAASDNMPITYVMKKMGGYRSIPSGRSVVEEALSDQNDTVDWVGRSGQVPLTENNILDAPEFLPNYLMGSMIITQAEKLENRGEDRYIPLITTKMEGLEITQRNKLHEAVLSNGTGSGGLQMPGLAALVSTTPTTGEIGGIDRADANAAWFRNQKFDTGADWSDGSVDAGNVKRFLDKGMNATNMNSMPTVQVGFMGNTHWEALTSAIGAMQQIQSESDSAKVGHNKIVYRSVPMYLSGGLNYSGFSTQTATRTYLLNVQRGGFNLVFMKDAEFEMLDPVDSSDQAVISRLMFTMCYCTIGAFAKRCWVGFD